MNIFSVCQDQDRQQTQLLTITMNPSSEATPPSCDVSSCPAPSSSWTPLLHKLSTESIL